MKVTTKGRYALRLILYLCMHRGSAVSLKEISEKQGISQKYLEQIVPLLAKENLIKGTRGSKGGYSVLREASCITVHDVVTAVEDVYEHIAEDAMTDHIWEGADKAAGDYLKSMTVQDIIEHEAENEFYSI